MAAAEQGLAHVEPVYRTLTMRELALALGVTDTTVHRFVSKYGIANRKSIGRVVLVDVASVIERLPDVYKRRFVTWYNLFLSDELEARIS